MVTYANRSTNGGAAARQWIRNMAVWRRPPSYWVVAVLHLPLSLLFGAALLLPQLVSLNQLPLIPCTFLHLTGHPCPLCGFTRAFWAIVNGRWSVAMADCPLAFLLVLYAALMFLWHSSALLSGVVLSPGPKLRPGPRGRRIMVWTVLGLLVFNWIYRLVGGLI
jgi:hypothetical protein